MSKKPTDLKKSTSDASKTTQINRKISKQSQRQSIISKDNLRNGFFRKAIPIMPSSLAIFCMILNIILPGIGTLISSFTVFFGAKHNYDKNYKSFSINIIAFILQLSTSVIIFGWVWSIKYGLLFVQLSDKKGNVLIDPELPLFVRRHSSVETSLIYTKPRLSLNPLEKLNEEEP